MFVVQIVIDDETTDLKAFEQKRDAEHRFMGVYRQVVEDEYQSVAIFEVSNAANAREAVHAVKNVDKKAVQLLKLKECPAKILQRMLDSGELNI